MANRRIIYSQEAAFVAETPASGFFFDADGNGIGDSNTGVNLISQLHRIQSITHNWTAPRENVRQFGNLAPIDQIIVAPPSITFDLSWILTNVLNESRVGLYTNGDSGVLANVLNGTKDERNYFIKLVQEGQDANNQPNTDDGCIGIGNGFLTSYTAQAAVGGLPTASIAIEGKNTSYDITSSGIQTPAVNPVNGQRLTGIFLAVPNGVSGVAGQLSALQPGNIQVNIGNASIGVQSGVCIQSFNLSIPLTRQPQDCLGSKFAQNIFIQFPITATLTVDTQLKELASGSVADLICNDQTYEIDVNMYAPACNGNGLLKYQIRAVGAKIAGENFSSTLGANKTVNLSYSITIGSAADLVHNVFMSGSLV